MRSKIIRIGILFLLALCLSGCSLGSLLGFPSSNPLAGTWTCSTSEDGAQFAFLFTFQQYSSTGVVDITIDSFGTSYQQQDTVTIINSTTFSFPLYSFTGQRKYEGTATVSYHYQPINKTLVLSGISINSTSQQLICYPQAKGA